MLAERRILVSLLSLVAHLPSPPPQKRKRGRQETYSDKLFIKALIVMIIRRLYCSSTVVQNYALSAQDFSCYSSQRMLEVWL